MIFTAILITGAYTLLMISFVYGYTKVPCITKVNTAPENDFSVVIPFRNEAENLPGLLQSIAKLNYPVNRYEIILVNDASTDEFLTIINQFKTKHKNIRIAVIENIRLSSSPKKDAITTAIKKASFEWIVTTDADCIVPENWLYMFNLFIKKTNPIFISGPVRFIPKNQFLASFQSLNFLSLIGSTIGSFGLKKPIMCNGANLCYRKAAFLKLNGFEGNTKVASGDDVFLLEKMYRLNASKTLFLKSEEAIVQTKPLASWKLFLHQQIRWASKSVHYKNTFSKLTGAVVLLQNACVLIGFFAFATHTITISQLMLICIPKWILDYTLIYKTSSFLNTKKSLWYFPVISLLYPVFIWSIILLASIKKYRWKERVF
ncbi:glycosyltransferase family 2 protein [Lutibacter sp.]